MDGSRDATTSGADVAEAVLDIEGMTCASCVARVEKRLGRVEGVRAAVNLATETARVQYPAGLDTTALVEAVRAAGYDATVRTRAASRATGEPVASVPVPAPGGEIDAVTAQSLDAPDHGTGALPHDAHGADGAGPVHDHGAHDHGAHDHGSDHGGHVHDTSDAPGSTPLRTRLLASAAMA
ncbi:MAG: cation transport ATPase, partial [Microbacterium sp.]|nr:cation transport ATPase [Microbacterium sp.]